MFENVFAAAITAAVPLLFATIGEIYCERSGNLNLGVEGNMMLGAALGFIAAFYTKNPLIAVLACIFAGILGNLIYAVLTITLRANQTVTGLALTIFGSGMAGFLALNLVGNPVPETVKTAFSPIAIPLLSNFPLLGVLFDQNILVYICYLVTIFSQFYFNHTTLGLNLKSIGENPAAADAAGINVNGYKYVHILFGGALMGLAGGYISLISVPVWQEGVTAGKGWIAVALVIFAGWSPFRAFFASLLFGFLDIIGLRLQAVGIHISQYLIEILPYLTTMIVLVFSDICSKGKNKAPKALSIPYFREER